MTRIIDGVDNDGSFTKDEVLSILRGKLETLQDSAEIEGIVAVIDQIEAGDEDLLKQKASEIAQDALNDLDMAELRASETDIDF